MQMKTGENEESAIWSVLMRLMKTGSVRLAVILPTALFLSAELSSAQPAIPAWVVYGIDTSGSYHLIDDALRTAAAQSTREAKHGDVWFFRQINDRSYDESAAILTVRCPAAPAPVVNPYDRKAKARQQAAAQALQQVLASAADYLRGFHPRPSHRTDVIGFFAKAGELLEAAPPNAVKEIRLSSDLADNVGQKAEVNLSGVRVIVSMFQGGASAQGAQMMRRTWSQRLLKWGAKDVQFLDPSQASVVEAIRR